MGYRYRKSINFKGGLRINFSKSGVGYSIGTKWFRITKTAKGTTRCTTSIPGTGISNVTETKSNEKRENTSFNEQAEKYEARENVALCIFFVLLMFSPVCAFMGSYMWIYIVLMLVPGFFKLYYKTKKEEQNECSDNQSVEEEKTIQNGIKEDDPSNDAHYFNEVDITRELLKIEEGIAGYLLNNDVDSAIKLSMDVLEYIENKGHGSDKHFSILRQLDLFYPRRHEFEDVNYHCMYLCNLDISEGDKTLQFLKTPVYFVTTTRMAIMLEQQGRIDDAIDVCNWAIERHLWDYRKNSFLDRKLRLLRKKEKSQSNPEYKF